jgi:hypothetical protein
MNATNAVDNTILSATASASTDGIHGGSSLVPIRRSSKTSSRCML